jgi:hypothetical protein
LADGLRLGERDGAVIFGRSRALQLGLVGR